VDKSLVVADTSGETARYRLLETIRHDSLGKLLEEENAQVAGALRDSHADAYLGLAISLGASLSTAEAFNAMERLEVELPNIRVALSHVLASGRPDRPPGKEEVDAVAIRAAQLRAVLLGPSDPSGAAEQIEAVIEQAQVLGDFGVTARALNLGAWVARSQGDRARSERLHAESVTTARRGGDANALAIVLQECGTWDELTEALFLTRASGDLIGEYTVLTNLANLALVNGDWPKARDLAGRAVSILDRCRFDSFETAAPLNLGLALVLGGEHEMAREQYRRAVLTSRRQVDERDLGCALIGLGLCASRDGDLIGAATLFGAGGQRFVPGIATAGERALHAEQAHVRSLIESEKFEAAMSRGRALSKSEAADLGLGQLGHSISRSATG
jgi:tetratricopeptide (TPR) repeat protein